VILKNVNTVGDVKVIKQMTKFLTLRMEKELNDIISEKANDICISKSAYILTIL